MWLPLTALTIYAFVSSFYDNDPDKFWYGFIATIFMLFINLSLFSNAQWWWNTYIRKPTIRSLKPGTFDILLTILALVSFLAGVACVVFYVRRGHYFFESVISFILASSLVITIVFGFCPPFRWGAEWDDSTLKIGRGPGSKTLSWSQISCITFYRYEKLDELFEAVLIETDNGETAYIHSLLGPPKSSSFIYFLQSEAIKRHIDIDYRNRLNVMLFSLKEACRSARGK